jgi:hypothetical protein
MSASKLESREMVERGISIVDFGVTAAEGRAIDCRLASVSEVRAPAIAAKSSAVSKIGGCKVGGEIIAVPHRQGSQLQNNTAVPRIGPGLPPDEWSLSDESAADVGAKSEHRVARLKIQRDLNRSVFFAVSFAPSCIRN